MTRGDLLVTFSSLPSELTAPALLISMPQVLDPFFHRSVVLLLHQDHDEGSIGFILNRGTEIKVSEILAGLDIEWQGDEELLARFGGPVQPQLGSILVSPDQVPADQLSALTEIAPGVAMTQHVEDLGVLAAAPPERFHLLLGYAGWGAEQLVDEILRHDWLVAPLDTELVFTLPTDDLWERAVRSVGIDPSILPAWTPGSDEDPAN